MSLGMKILILLIFVFSISWQPIVDHSNSHKENAYTEISLEEDLRSSGFDLFNCAVNFVVSFDIFFEEYVVQRQSLCEKEILPPTRLIPLLLDLPPPVLS